MKSGNKSKRGRQPRGLASIEQLYFGVGVQAAEESFRAAVPEAELTDCYKIRAGDGRPSYRTDVTAEDGITYRNYSPPRSWEAPYSVQLADFRPVPKAKFMFHAGEEILVPVSGQITYQFFWSPGAKPPERFGVRSPLSYGSIIRINPQVPHHTWAITAHEAKAWMVFRYASGSPTALTADSEFHQSARTIEEHKLREPGRYGLVAWGIAEKIKNLRLRANLSVGQLAEAVGATPAYISRIEAADTNISLPMLTSLGRVLNMGLADVIEQHPWYEEVGSFSSATSPKPQYVLPPPPLSRRHLLHPQVYSLRELHVLKPRSFGKHGAPGDFTTWIVLKGSVVVRIPEREAEILDEGAVIHFRQRVDISFQALRPTQLIRFKFSGDCECSQEA